MNGFGLVFVGKKRFSKKVLLLHLFYSSLFIPLESTTLILDFIQEKAIIVHTHIIVKKPQSFCFSTSFLTPSLQLCKMCSFFSLFIYLFSSIVISNNEDPQQAKLHDDFFLQAFDLLLI